MYSVTQKDNVIIAHFFAILQTIVNTWKFTGYENSQTLKFTVVTVNIIVWNIYEIHIEFHIIIFHIRAQSLFLALGALVQPGVDF